MANNSLDATAPVSRELTVRELGNVNGGFASSEHGSGGATSGDGVGKATFNQFTVKKTTDAASPLF